MATKLEYAPIDIPNTDLWDLLFERKTEFPSSKGEQLVVFSSLPTYWGLSLSPLLVDSMRLMPLISLSIEDTFAWDMTLQYRQLTDTADE